jgi:hypothetical protein
MTRGSKVILQASMLLLTLGYCKGDTDPNFEKQAATLLLQQYETVVSARSQILSQLHYFDHPEQEVGPKSLGLPFIYLMAGLKAVGPNMLGALEAGSDTVLTGAKDFARPGGLGMVSSHACFIAILAPGTDQTLAREFSKVKVTPIDGRNVWTWSITPSEGDKTPVNFYATIVGSSLFVLTKEDQEDLRKMANALAKGTVQTDLLIGRLTVLRGHAYWAYRAIRRPEKADTFASRLNVLPVSAVGLELFTEYNDGKLFFGIVVPDDRSGSTPQGLPSSESIHFQRAGSGVWQAVIDLTTQTSNQKISAVLETMSYFGYGLIL